MVFPNKRLIAPGPRVPTLTSPERWLARASSHRLSPHTRPPASLQRATPRGILGKDWPLQIRLHAHRTEARATAGDSRGQPVPYQAALPTPPHLLTPKAQEDRPAPYLSWLISITRLTLGDSVMWACTLCWPATRDT